VNVEHSAVVEAVAGAVEQALGVEPEEVVGDATLLGDLGAESIDLLDILFRLERATGVRISAGELASYVQGGIPDEDFGDDDEVITELGLAQLARVMPQIDKAALSGRLRADSVMSLFSVDNLVQLVLSRLDAPLVTGPGSGDASDGTDVALRLTA
jgi:acyl carrier protein